MTRMLGVALAAFAVGACGHATTTGSAKNNWATPTGYASATDPRYINPDAAAHPAHDRSVFARREAPTLQPEASTPAPSSTEVPIAPEPPGAVPPPAEPLPAPEAVPDINVPDTGPRSLDTLPPYGTPPRP